MADKLYEGDRYKVDETDYYTVNRHPMYKGDQRGSDMAAYAILDEEDGGYIAFCTDESSAEKIVAALNGLGLEAVIVKCKDCRTEFAAPRTGKLSRTCPGCKAIAQSRT